MNIIEAIKSGRNFTNIRLSKSYYNRPETFPSFTYEELMADDWEVKEEKIEITKSQVLEIFDIGFKVGKFSHPIELLSEKLKELGFRP